MFGNADGLAGLRNPADPCFPLPYLEGPKAGDGHPLTSGKAIGDCRQKNIHRPLGGSFGEPRFRRHNVN